MQKGCFVSKNVVIVEEGRGHVMMKIIVHVGLGVHQRGYALRVFVFLRNVLQEQKWFIGLFLPVDINGMSAGILKQGLNVNRIGMAL